MKAVEEDAQPDWCHRWAFGARGRVKARLNLCTPCGRHIDEVLGHLGLPQHLGYDDGPSELLLCEHPRHEVHRVPQVRWNPRLKATEPVPLKRWNPRRQEWEDVC